MARRDTVYGLLFAGPAVLLIGLFILYPALRTLWLAFNEWNILSPPTFVGLGNFLEITADPRFHNSIGVTLYYVLGSTLITIPLAFVVALGLNAISRLRGLLRAIIFAPVVLSVVMASVLFISVFHPFGGIMKLLPLPLGLDSVNWYQNKDLVIPGLIIFTVWKGLGIYVVLSLAALATIPEELLDAARIDGANRRQLLRWVVLPLLRPVFLFQAVISIVYGFQNFAIVFASTKGGPVAASQILPILIYESGFRFFRMGYASALAVIMFVVVAILVVVQFRLFRSDVAEKR